MALDLKQLASLAHEFLQIDTDDDAGWMWGDGGTLYFGTRDADLASSDLDRAWMVPQMRLSGRVDWSVRIGADGLRCYTPPVPGPLTVIAEPCPT